MQAQNKRRVSTHLQTESLQQGKVLRGEADLFFEFPSGRVIMYNQTPEEFVFISNPLGEARIFHPKQNKVVAIANEMLTSRNNNLYHFLTNQTYDLGLQDMGFSIINSRQEEAYFITTWQAPVHLLSQVDQIEMVHEELLPIHAAYTDTEGEKVLSVYFDDFIKLYDSQVPTMITEIIYLPTGDSLIKRMQYSNHLYGASCDQTKFNFEIPEHATVIK